MPERKEGTGTSSRKIIKLTPAIGDWTTLKPSKIPEKRVKIGLYGFDRISQGELSHAHIIHYNFAHALLKDLKITLGIGGELYTVSAEQTSYSDFIKRLFHPMVHAKISIPDFPSNIHFCMELSVANTLINHALGSRDLTPLNRKLTEIEEETLNTLISEHLGPLAEAYSGAIENPRFEIISSPDFSVDSAISPTTTFTFFITEIAMGDNPPAKILIGYQSKALKSLLEKVELASPMKPLDLSKLPEMVYNKILVSVASNLGETAIATEDLQALEVGDIVALDIHLGNPLLLTLGNKAKLAGSAGIHGGKRAIRIISSIEGKILKIPEEEKVEEVIPETPKEEIAPSEKELLEKETEEGYPIDEEFSEEEELEEEFPEEEYPGKEV